METVTKGNTMKQQPDVQRTVTIDEARALGGILGIVAAAMLQSKGEYGYTDVASGKEVKVLLRLAR